VYNLTKPERFEIVIEEQSNINTMSFVVEVDTEPFNDCKDFVLEIVVMAKPITDLTSEKDWFNSIKLPTYRKIITLTCQDFMHCHAGNYQNHPMFVYGLGHRFDDHFESDDYYLSAIVISEQDDVEISVYQY
tara:strand:- start:208 stop:603 length:396 start_codon:yes stop_codon:yes gene_type:complete